MPVKNKKSWKHLFKAYLFNVIHVDKHNHEITNRDVGLNITSKSEYNKRDICSLNIKSQEKNCKQFLHFANLGKKRRFIYLSVQVFLSLNDDQTIFRSAQESQNVFPQAELRL